MTWHLDSYPLAEEIGDPDLFAGREQEMARLLEWGAGTKRRISKSMAILSRRKLGKTALLQRFFNILYTRGDPQLIPFYYRIPENVQTKSDFTESFYRRVLTQYFAFTTRTPEWVAMVLTLDALKDLATSDRVVADDIARAPTAAWLYAQEAAHRISQLKDVRIPQILDEFQYMNKYVVSDDETALMIEVKDWEGEPPLDAVRRFVNVRTPALPATLAGSAGRKNLEEFRSGCEMRDPFYVCTWV